MEWNAVRDMYLIVIIGFKQDLICPIQQGRRESLISAYVVQSLVNLTALSAKRVAVHFARSRCQDNNRRGQEIDRAPAPLQRHRAIIDLPFPTTQKPSYKYTFYCAASELPLQASRVSIDCEREG